MKYKYPTLEGRLNHPLNSRGDALQQMKANGDILSPLAEKELQKYENKNSKKSKSRRTEKTES